MGTEEVDIEDVMVNRRIARKMVGGAASKGHPLAGMLAELERIAEPFFLGIDADPDDSDLDVFP